MPLPAASSTADAEAVSRLRRQETTVRIRKLGKELRLDAMRTAQEEEAPSAEELDMVKRFGAVQLLHDLESEDDSLKLRAAAVRFAIRHFRILVACTHPLRGARAPGSR